MKHEKLVKNTMNICRFGQKKEKTNRCIETSNDTTTDITTTILTTGNVFKN